MLRANPHRSQMVLDTTYKIDKDLPFKGKCSNEIMNSHVRKRLLNMYARA
jgi:hypothetical protein